MLVISLLDISHVKKGKLLFDFLENNVQYKSQYIGLVSSGGLVDVGLTIKALKAGSLIFYYQDLN